MLILEIMAGLTAYAVAIVAEKYVKTYKPEIWQELNKWGD